MMYVKGPEPVPIAIEDIFFSEKKPSLSYVCSYSSHHYPLLHITSSPSRESVILHLNTKYIQIKWSMRGVSIVQASFI